MRLLLIDNYDSFTFNLYHALIPYFDSIRVCRNDDDNIASSTEFDAMVISPGPGLPAEAGKCMHLLREYADTKPILGICLGHQAIVEYFGGSLLNLDDVLHGKSRAIIISKHTDPIYQGIESPFMGGRYHSWVADPKTIPSMLNISAIDNHQQVMSVKHTILPIWGIQYHPESVLTSCGPMILKNWALAAHTYLNQ